LKNESGALNGAPGFGVALRIFARGTKHCIFGQKKQGAAGITTAAPHIAGQWGRGDNRLPG
jgi:hypothetical protein